MKPALVLSGLTASLSLQWGTASLIELLWTLTGLVGIYLTWANLQDARQYITALEKVNGQKSSKEVKIIAFGHYRNELFRIMMFLVVTGIGVVAMLTPPAIKNSPVTPVSIAITLGLFTLTALLVMASFLDKRQRELLAGGV